MISFVFYACESRLQNLLQTLRFLEKREKEIKKEIIVVWQDAGPSIKNAKCFNLKMNSYNKPKQCNFGVKQAQYPLVALLDSDRILPKNYFAEQSAFMLKGHFVTTTNLFKLVKDYEDSDIENYNYKYIAEARSQKNEIKKKNLFSGNTLFWKEDYWSCDGMDEKYVGYGYADNDMTKTIESAGHKPFFVNFGELHLSHKRSINFEGQEIENFKILSMTNLIRYCNKWKIKDDLAEKMIDETCKSIKRFPTNTHKPFIQQYKTRYGLHF